MSTVTAQWEGFRDTVLMPGNPHPSQVEYAKVAFFAGAGCCLSAMLKAAAMTEPAGPMAMEAIKDEIVAAMADQISRENLRGAMTQAAAQAQAPT